jgi:hypothetical protein
VCRDDETTTAAYLHPHDSFVPTFDDVTRAQREREWLAPVPRGVELFATRDTHAHVVHDRSLANLGLFTVADHDFFDEQF